MQYFHKIQKIFLVPTTQASANFANTIFMTMPYHQNQQKALVGMKCTINTDCMVGAYCKGNTDPASCQCLSTHVAIKNICKQSMFIYLFKCVYLFISVNYSLKHYFHKNI